MYETYLKNKYKKGLHPIDTKNLHTTLKRAFGVRRESNNPVVKALRYGLPVIVGRKCEPFCESEKYFKATLKVMGLLKEYDVPTVVETKCEPFLQEHIDQLSELDAGVNVTITPGDDSLASQLGEPTSYSNRLEFAKELKEIGLWVGITGEPIISGVNDSHTFLVAWTQDCANLKPSHVNFGDLRVSNLSGMSKRMDDAGFDLAKIFEQKRNTWIQTGETIFDLLHQHNLLVTTPDWVNFAVKNDIESCCGFMGVKFKFHPFTFQHAVGEIKRNGKVTFSEILKGNPFGEKYVEKFRDIWNGKGGYFNLSDVKGVSRLGKDGDGNVIYGKAKTLKDVFI